MKENGLTLKNKNWTIRSVLKCQKPSLDCYGMTHKFFRGPDGAIHYDDIIEEYRKEEFINAPHWSIDKWISVLAKGGGEKQRFQYCLNPNSSNQFLYFRAIQRHSGSSIIDLALQDNVLLPEGFTEYIYHVKNANELRSKVINGLIPGGKASKRRRQAAFSTIVNTMDDQNDLGETLFEARLAPYKNTWKRPQNTVSWCNLKLGWRERTAILPNKVTCGHPLDTLPAEFIEKAACMKTKDDFIRRKAWFQDYHVLCSN